MFNFLLQALFTADTYSVETCHMPREHTIGLIYLISILVILFKLLKIKIKIRRINI